jgi:ABC-2 type transport system permease protein
MNTNILTKIIAKELRDFRSDKRLQWALSALYLLFALALFSGWRYYTTTQPRHEAAQAASYSQWLAQGTKNPHSAAHYGFYAYKPVPLMAIVDKGMDEYLGVSVWMEAHKQNSVSNRTAHDMADVSRFGSLTVGFVMQFLLPLVIVLLTFNAVSKERESGTLRILLSTHTSGVQLLAGKGAAVMLFVLAAIVVPMLLASGLVMLSTLYTTSGSAFAALPDTVSAFGVWSLAVMVSVLLWTALGLAVSASVRESGMSLIVLLGVWTFGAFFVPRLSGSLATTLHPTPSAFAFNETIVSEKVKGVDGHNAADARAKELEARVLKEYGVDSLSQLPVSFAGISLQAGEEHDYIVFDKNYGSLFQTFQRQESVMEAMNVLSPVLAAQSLSRALAGTDGDKHEHFTTHAEQFRRVIMRTMNADMTENGAKDKTKRDFGYMADDALWKKIPPYAYTAPGLVFALGNQTLSIASLLGWTLAALFMLIWRGRSLKP